MSHQKALHKHTVPLLLLSAGLFLFTLVGVSQMLQLGTSANDSVTKLLTARVFTIRPAANGLVHVSRFESVSQFEAHATRSTSSTGLGAISSAGKTTQLNAMLDSLDPSQE